MPLYHGAPSQHKVLKPLSKYKPHNGLATLWATHSKREAERYAVTSKKPRLHGSSNYVFIHHLANDGHWVAAHKRADPSLDKRGLQSESVDSKGKRTKTYGTSRPKRGDGTVFRTDPVKPTGGHWVDRRDAKHTGDVLGAGLFAHVNRSPGNRTIKPEKRSLPVAHPSFYGKHDRTIRTGAVVAAAAGGVYAYRHRQQIHEHLHNFHAAIKRHVM